MSLNERQVPARCRYWPALLGLAALLVLWAVPSAAAPLHGLPLGERWFTIRMQGDLVGFGRQVISRVANGYEISTESGANMVVLGFRREASSRERYLVGDDFSLKSFSVEQTIDRSPLNLTGTVTTRGISATVTVGGKSREQAIPAKGALYPPALVNLYPLLKGAVVGKRYRLQMFDPEAVKVRTVTITAIGQDDAAATPVFHFRNDLYPFVDNDVWVDAAGNTLRESVRNGLVETVAESAAAAQQSLVAAAVAKKDLVLDFSLIRLDHPLERPHLLTRLDLELSGYPDAVPLVVGPGQQMERLPGERVRIVREPVSSQQTVVPLASELLQATVRMPVDSGIIQAKAREVLAGETDARRQVAKLSAWVAAFVRDTVTDGQSALDTLATGEGNCVSHARLFVTLARAAGLPSRLVAGLVYAPEKGFLYHAWAEVDAGGWLAVDPTFNQVPADLTHLKLVAGEAPDAVAPLAGLIGRVKARVLETRYASPP
jgi:transglutaminase-like putative cysteine protease